MDWLYLTSRQNGTVKSVCSLRDKKYRDEMGLFPVEGIKFLSDLAKDGIVPAALFLSEDSRLDRARAEEMAGEKTRLYLVTPSVYEKISEEQAGEGVLALYEKSSLPAPRGGEKRVIALEGVQDPGNVGACVRSAAALGFDAVWVARCADVLGSKALRSSMGALFRIPVVIFPDGKALLSAAREKNLLSVAACLSGDAVSLSRVDLRRPVCLFIGSEGQGLTEEVARGADVRAVIPMRGMESVNAAAAAAIFMWEAVRDEA